MLGGSGHFGAQNTGFIVTLVAVAAIILLRNSRARRLRIERLWVRPLLFLAIMATTLAAAPPPLTALGVGLPLFALIVGCALGWQRGRLMRIEVDPQTHDLTSRASPVGIVFILVLIVARFWMRGALGQGTGLGGLSASIATDALIALTAGMMATQSLEMWLRARRLLAEAIAAKERDFASADPIVR